MVEGEQYDGYEQERDENGCVSFSVNGHLFILKNGQKDEIQKYKRS